jgi:hypothetical protein
MCRARVDKGSFHVDFFPEVTKLSELARTLLIHLPIAMVLPPICMVFPLLITAPLGKAPVDVVRFMASVTLLGTYPLCLFALAHLKFEVLEVDVAAVTGGMNWGALAMEFSILGLADSERPAGESRAVLMGIGAAVSAGVTSYQIIKEAGVVRQWIRGFRSWMLSSNS